MELKTSSTPKSAARKKYIRQFARNPLISYADIAELLNVSRAYVQQVVEGTPGLLEQREASRKKYFNRLGGQIVIPE